MLIVLRLYKGLKAYSIDEVNRIYTETGLKAPISNIYFHNNEVEIRLNPEYGK